MNISRRGRDYERAIKADYLDKIQRAYLQFFRMLTKQIVLTVNISDLNFVENKMDYQKLTELIKHDYTPGMHFVTV